MGQVGNQVNRSQLAGLFGVNVVTVDAWVRAGAPFVQRANMSKRQPWIFDTAAVSRWREQTARDTAGGQDTQDDATLRRRKLSAEARIAELEVTRRQAPLASVAEIHKTWIQVVAQLRAELRGPLIESLARLLIGQTDERTFKRILREEIDSALEQLAEMEIEPAEEPGADAPT